MKRQMGLTSRAWLLSLVAAALLVSAAAGQDITGQRIYDEQLRLQLDSQMPSSRETSFDAGGWLNLALFLYEDDGARTERRLMQYTLYPWAKLNVRNVHQVYVRGLLRYDDWHHRDNPSVFGRGDDFDEDIDRAWYQFDLGQLIMLKRGQKPPWGFKVKVGRQFSAIGTALALSIPLDAVRFDLTTTFADVMVIFGRSVPDVPNMDQSANVYGEQDRAIFGVQVTGKINQHRPFVYFLLNDDHTDPDPPQPLVQAYDYSSRYIGVGSTGSILLPRLQYLVEFVGEWGKTYGSGARAGRDDIRAAAVDVQLGYRFDRPCRPKIFGEYLFATGDEDRSSAVSTAGGNRMGSMDKAFNALGFRDTGVAFAPQVSNLHMFMFGGTAFPFYDTNRFFKELEVGTKVYFYWKADGEGAVSDGSAGSGSWLGWEWDIFFNWRITSDLAWTTRYGMFFPGTAFNRGDKSCRHFLYTGIIFSF